MTRKEAIEYSNTKSRKNGDISIYSQKINILINQIYDGFNETELRWNQAYDRLAEKYDKLEYEKTRK